MKYQFQNHEAVTQKLECVLEKASKLEQFLKQDDFFTEDLMLHMRLTKLHHEALELMQLQKRAQVDFCNAVAALEYR